MNEPSQRLLRRASGLLGAIVALVIAVSPTFAAIPLPVAPSASYTQSFDSIGTAATAPLPADFKVDKLTTVRTVGTYASAATATERLGGEGLSTTAANGIYNVGAGPAATATDRAVGFLSSGSGTTSGNLYGQFQNGSQALSGLTISYNVERYRNGSNPAGFRIQLFYSSDGAAWTDAGPAFLTTFAPNGDNSGCTPAPCATQSVSNQPLNVSVPANALVYLAWSYSVASGSTTTNSQALAIDDISVRGVAGGGGGDTAPSVASTNPANNATNVPVGANITVTFSEPVTAPASAFALSCNGATQTFALSPSSGSSLSFTLDPNASLPAGATCTVTVTGASVTDVDGSPDTVAGTPSFTFTTVAPAPTVLIRDIQGAGHTSPKAGQTVTNVSGIVTAKRTDGTGNNANTGFYLQDPSPDADDKTSEAIFVRTQAGAAPVNVGDAVTVSTGVVREWRPGCTTQPAFADTCAASASGFNNLTLTWLVVASNGDIQVTSTNNPLPAAIVIGQGGRVPPTTNVSDDVSNIDTAAGATFDPANDGADFFESLEFMRVQVNNAVVVGPKTTNGEIGVLGDNGTNATGLRTPHGGILYNSYADDQPERIILDDQIIGFAAMPAAHVGGTITQVVGVMDYSFANFKLQVTTAPVLATNPLQRETTSSPSAGELTVATFNVENLTDGDPQAKFDTLATLIVTNMKAPDLIVIEEIQDNNGESPGVVAADEVWTKLIQTIQTVGSITYRYQQIDPQDGTDGGAPNGNIRQGFLYRTDRGLAFVARTSGGLDCSTGSPTPAACATTATTVQNVGGVPQLSLSPGRVSPGDGAWSASRKPLAAEFTFNGRPLFVVGNHFNSKGGDQPLYGRFDPPVRSSEAQRHQQATLLNQFVNQILTIDSNALVVAAGDFNDFDFSQTLAILRTGDASGGGDVELRNLYETLPPNERYSYVFDANSQILDSILVSPFLFSGAQYDVVHVNAELADQASDHDPSVARLLIDATPPTVTCSVSPASMWPPNHKLQQVTLTVNVTDGGSGPAGWKLVSVSSNEPDSGDGDIQGWMLGTPDTTGELRVERSGSGSGRIYTFLVEGQDKQGNAATCTTTVTVAHDQGGGNGR